MLRFLLGRIGSFIPLLAGVAFLSFLFIHAAPGDYFDHLQADPQISQETIALYKARYHLDKPILVQFWYWFGAALQGDFGYSFSRKAPVLTIISQHAFSTLILAVTSMLITWLTAVPLGLMAAVRRNSLFDRGLSLTALFCVSIPSFILALLLLLLASLIPGVPVGGMTSLNHAALPWYGQIFDVCMHLLVPALAISILSMASLIRITRANMLETLRKPFILTARAQGLPEPTIHKQAFQNAMNPLITMLGYEFAGLLSGSAIIEIICNWPGLGSVMLEAVLSQDLFLVMGGIMMGAVLLMIGNLLADVLLVLTDPRISLSSVRSS